MLKNNKLIDLFVRGKDVVLTDPATGEEAHVWLQKLNPSEHEAIVRHANAARAKCLTMTRDPEQEEYQSLYGTLLDMEKEELIEIIIAEEVAQKVSAIESEVSEKDEWKDNNYLQGLRDAWEDGLREKFHADKDEEAVKVFEELKRFAEQVAKEVDGFKADLVADHLERSLDKLVEDAMQSKIDAQGNIEWLKAFRKGQLVYAVRDGENHKERLLDWNNIDDLQEEAFNRLAAEYRLISVDPVEGKD